MGQSAESSSYKLVIVGGGTGGITIAARMKKHFPAASIALLEPSEQHFYQPMWTLVGGGEVDKSTTVKPESSVMPEGIAWIKARAETFLPEENALLTDGGQRIEYEILVVSPGLVIDLAAIKGLPEALKSDPRVVTNYLFEYADKTFEAVEATRKGRAIFTHPSTPIKCGGAPQKAMYLSEDFWRQHGVRDDVEVCGYFATPSIFAVPLIREALDPIIERRDIHMHYRRDLVEVRPETSEAVFVNLDSPEETEVVKYDFLHVTPKMFPPKCVAESPFAHQEGPTKGWFNVDIHTLQSPDFPNVFALGDCAALPTSKTGAGIRKQAKVVEENILHFLGGTVAEPKYDGYTSCPLVMGYGRLILAEFDYNDNLKPSFPGQPLKEKWSMYMLKKYGLPVLYWKFMLRGKA